MNAIGNNPNREDNAMNEQIESLAESFPTLQGRPGTQPWDAEELDAWAVGPAPGHGARSAARFVLTVWNEAGEWQCGRFELMEALACWDSAHRAAFLEWAREPWWP